MMKVKHAEDEAQNGQLSDVYNNIVSKVEKKIHISHVKVDF